MSHQVIPQQSIQIKNTTSAQTLLSVPNSIPIVPDIRKLILANASSSNCLVTLSDGVKNYYYAVPANSTITDSYIPSTGTNANKSGQWTIACASSIDSLWVSAIFG